MFSHSLVRNFLGSIHATWKPITLITLGAVCLTAGTGKAAQASTIIDTTPYLGWGGIGLEGEESFNPYNPDRVITGGVIGQTFTTPTNGDTILSSFSIGRLQNYVGEVKLRALVMGWDGAKPTGSVLYQSETNSLSNQFNLQQTLSFNTGGLSLAAGSQYVLLLTGVLDFDGLQDVVGIQTMALDYGGSDAYSGGNAVVPNRYVSSLNDLATVENWGPVQNIRTPDLSFTAEFTSAAAAVPTPALLPGLLGLGLGVLRKRKAAQTEAMTK
jgi:hypothetical protein